MILGILLTTQYLTDRRKYFCVEFFLETKNISFSLKFLLSLVIEFKKKSLENYLHCFFFVLYVCGNDN